MPKSMRLTPTQKAEMFQKAWDFCWALVADGQRYNCHWVTATDLHRRIRAHAVEVLKGLEYGSQGTDAWMAPVRLTGFDLTDCRSWLGGQVRAGKLRADQPSGSRTCSGLRFRPAGMELTDADKKMRENATKVKPFHMAGKRWSPLCVKPAAGMTRSRFSGMPTRSSALMTRDEEKVTCPRCKKLIPLIPVSFETEFTVTIPTA